jgi:hypothetical protein
VPRIGGHGAPFGAVGESAKGLSADDSNDLRFLGGLPFNEEARLSPGLFSSLLLLALGVSLLAVLAGILRVLLGARGVLLAFCVVILAVVLGSSAMRFGGILVVFSRLIVFVLSH